MKQTIKLFVLGLVLFSSTSCGDDFFVVIPDNTSTDEEFINTTEEAQEALVGAYKSLASGDFLGGQAWLLSELTADHLYEEDVINNYLTNGDWLAVYTRTTDIFLGVTRSMWSAGYLAAGRANYMLSNLDNIPDLSGADRIRLEAEAKFIRAVAHFEMVRLFAQPYGFTSDNSHLGIPIATTVGIEPRFRSSVNAVYQTIIADLTTASMDLPGTNGGFATSWAAKGVLAQVYFQQNDFANAYVMSNEVINGSTAVWDTSLMNRFGEMDTPESVFSLESSDPTTDNSGGALMSYFREVGNNFPNVVLGPNIFAKATSDPTDKRGMQWFESYDPADPASVVKSLKFLTDASLAIDVPLVHLTELKLIRAESSAELNQNLTTAVQDINDIKARAGLAQIASSTSPSSIIQIARLEREIEMVFEGNRLHELKRQAVNGNSAMQIRGAPWNCNGMVLQIPDNELSGNIDMVPNPSGGCN